MRSEPDNPGGAVDTGPPAEAAAAAPGKRRSAREKRPRVRFVRQIVLLALLAGLPAVCLVVALPWLGGVSGRYCAILATIVVILWLCTVWALHQRLVRPLRTLYNVLSGVREGDYSFQARGAAPGDALGEVILEVNALVETMRQQRLGALEATALLRTVMAEIDVAVFAFDDEQRLRLVNRAGERLLARPSEWLLGRTAAELDLSECLEGGAPRTLQRSFGGGVGRWRIHRSQFRQGGVPHQLLVLSDLSRELREEELKAWQRLIRVLGHELNNSLAPVKSIAGSLAGLVDRDLLPEDWKSDMRDGLMIIASRAEALSRFVGAYATLAKLPKPKLQLVEIGPLVTRVAGLETRLPVNVLGGPDLQTETDADQLEHVLINLIRNAVDAVLESRKTDGAQTAPETALAQEDGVRIGWRTTPARLEVWVEDDGPGIANPTNLFVPFFTTKLKGSGIGLVLSRQIIEGHGGALTLENRVGARGCVARILLPLRAPAESPH